MQLNIFDMLKDEYKYDNSKPIRLIELFAGYGSQALALEFLNINFEHYKVCEFDKYAIETYNAFHNTNFATSDITQLKAKDLEINNTDQYTYVMTYSFPCTDLSLAGKRMGMEKGSGTRSGLLWEVERLLNELDNNLPQILLMENVPQVIKANGWEQWQAYLESKGYSNYCEILNAKDFGIPQNRERCFMISILGNYNYHFPQKIKLNYLLKDLLENEVDEKYYLSEEKIKQISNWKAQQDPLKDIDKEKKICPTLTARGVEEEHSGMILINEATIKGYAIAKEGDSVNLEQPNSKTRRGRVGKQEANTLTTSCNQGVVVLGNYMPSNHNASRIVDDNGIAPTVMENHGTVTAVCIGGFGNKCNKDKQYHMQNRVYDNKIATANTSSFQPYYYHNLCIRKLTPNECYKLMGVPSRINCKTKVSSSQQYKQAGNSIVTTVLMAIFGELLEIDWKLKINKLTKELVEKGNYD